MEQRPNLDRNLDSATFRSFYYRKEELVAFCRTNGIQATGGKQELTDRVAHYLDTGEKQTKHHSSKRTKPPQKITLETPIEEHLVCSEKHRAFYKAQIGPTFSFNVIFQQWLKNNAGKTYQDSIEAYYQIVEEKKKTKSIIGKQFEYNTYIRDFFADHPDKTRDEAIKCWNWKKQQKGSHRYEPTDLVIVKNDQ